MTRFLSIPAALLACLLLGACAKNTRTGGYTGMHVPASVAAGDSSMPDAADDKVMYLQLIRQMQKRGLYYASLAHIDAYAERYGTPPELKILRAEALRKTQNPLAAKAIYEKLTRGPQAGAAWHGLGLIAAAQGRYAQATDELAHAVQLDPVNPSYLGDLGYARLRAGDVAGARDPLATAAELAPDDVKAVANLALLLMVQGHDTKARDMMQQAKLPQDTRRAVARLAMQLRRANSRTGDHAGLPATTSSSFAAQTTPSNGEVPRAYGISANLLDRFDRPSSPRGEHHHEQP